jgi:hypothetical protein
VRKPALAEAAANRRGDKLVCKICALGVVIEEVSGLAVFEALILASTGCYNGLLLRVRMGFSCVMLNKSAPILAPIIIQKASW